MKTISVSDELYVLIEAAASRAKQPDIESFLSETVEVKEERRQLGFAQRIAAENQQIEWVKQKSRAGGELWLKFMRAMDAMHRVNPQKFSELEGLTKENGREIYVSSDERRISESASETKPVRLSNTQWFINAHIGQQDAPIIIDAARKLLGLSAGFGEELKKHTILTPSSFNYD